MKCVCVLCGRLSTQPPTKRVLLAFERHRLRELLGAPCAQPCANGFAGLVHARTAHGALPHRVHLALGALPIWCTGFVAQVLVLQAAGIGHGDLVIVPAFTMVRRHPPALRPSPLLSPRAPLLSSSSFA